MFEIVRIRRNAPRYKVYAHILLEFAIKTSYKRSASLKVLKIRLSIYEMTHMLSRMIRHLISEYDADVHIDRLQPADQVRNLNSFVALCTIYMSNIQENRVVLSTYPAPALPLFVLRSCAKAAERHHKRTELPIVRYHALRPLFLDTSSHASNRMFMIDIINP